MTPPALRMQWYEQHVAMKEQSLFKNLGWQFLGPTNISGRMTDIAVVEPRGKNYTIYVAGASGGVWRTSNEGTTWEPVFQHAASTSIGDVTLAPSNPDIVWVGTGEANIFRSSMAGSGVYKSTDAGESWQHAGLAGTHTIPRIVIHPANPDIVYVAASGHEWTDNEERGVYKTTDGGASWEKVLYIDEKTGAIDLVMNPSDPNILYAATWERIRKKWHDPRNHENSSGSGIYKTTDAGKTWAPINNGLPEAKFRGRIGIDLCRTKPNVLYAFIDNYEVARRPEADELDSYGRPKAPVIRGATVFRSDDSGENWRQVSEKNAYMERLSATYGWVFGQMRVDPTDENTIYVMGLALNVSNDGGKTFRRLPGMHGDHHGLWIDPANSNYLVNVNDGGVAISYDAGENWRTFYDNLPLVQFFNVNYDMAEPFHVYGSIQDHGSRRAAVDLSRGRSNIPAVEWQRAPGGEGSYHAIDPTDPNIVYSTGFYGRITRTDVSTFEQIDIVPKAAEGEPPLRGQWLAPFIISPHNPRILYHGMNFLFRSMNRGDKWEKISPDLTYNVLDKIGDIPYQTIYSISESPFKFGLIYAGTDDGRLHRTKDSGMSWQEIGKKLPREKFVSGIVASAYDEATVYLALNGKRDDDFAAYLYKSTDYGDTWQAISNNIPCGPVNVVREDPKNKDVLYAGTDLGAYLTLDGGKNWQVLAKDLPTTFVHDIIIHPRDDIIVAATHGRGMYAMDARIIQSVTDEVLAQDLHLFDIESVRVPRNRFGRAFPASILYYLKQAAEARLAIKDKDGKVVKEIEGTGVAGINVASWDLTGPSEGREGRGGFRRPAYVGTGKYTVELQAGAATAEATIEVKQ
jgi:photosystem II stability/assembly factor-like uncharacterized protein